MPIPLQNNNKTFLGRHWVEHSLLARYFTSDKNVSILSFGCSTGEELLSLRILFPNAKLFGCDIDWLNLRESRAKLGSRAIIFESTEACLMDHGPFDLILCNSVLLTPTKLEGGQKIGIDPKKWSNVLETLTGILNPGGFLQIINSNIPFRFHKNYRDFIPIRSHLVLNPNFVDQFDTEGNLLCTGVGGGGWGGHLNRHLSEKSWQQLVPSDLTDIHFYKIKKDIESPKPINDEISHNLSEGKVWAYGSASYCTPIEDSEKRMSTKVDIKIDWKAIGVDSVRIKRNVIRYWFDSSLASAGESTIELSGAQATAFFESMTGRASTKISMDKLLSSSPIIAPAFG